MKSKPITVLAWRWDDEHGSAGFRVMNGAEVVGVVAPCLNGECWEAFPRPMEYGPADPIPARGFRDLEAAAAYLEAYAWEADGETFAPGWAFADPNPTLPPGRTIYRASFESRHFSFEAYGLTAEEARAALAEAIKHHAATVPGVWPDWLAESLEEVASSHVQPFALAVGYRDGDRCAPKGEPKTV